MEKVTTIGLDIAKQVFQIEPKFTMPVAQMRCTLVSFRPTALASALHWVAADGFLAASSRSHEQ
ncbi:hypothetical protein ACC754_37785, partial [Rhizobium johnstonii]